MLEIILDFFSRFSTEVRAKLDDEVKRVEDEIDDTNITSTEEMSNRRKCFNLICGIEDQNESEEENMKSEEELAMEASEFLKEEPKYKR
jgi:hypothetical protein